MEKFVDFFKAIFIENQKLSVPRDVARHMARLVIYGKINSDISPDAIISSVEALHPEVRDRAIKLKDKMKQLGKPIVIFETLRTARRQTKLYNQGRDENGLVVDLSKIVTDGKAMEGYHSFGLAFDAIFEKYKWNPPSAEWWQILGEEGEKLGLEWGGRWNTSFGGDRPHFQLSVVHWSDLKKYFEMQ